MATERAYSFPESIYELLGVLPRKGQEKVAFALLELFFDGIEPEGLTKNEERVFNGVAGRTRASKRNSENRTKRTTKTLTKPATKTATKTATTTPPEGEYLSIDKYLEKEKGKGGLGGTAQRRFVKPSIEEIKAYATEIGYTTLDAQRFFDYYESNGWKVGRNPMRDWKATVRQWKSREKGGANGKPSEYDDLF